jgi:parallel beta-helix repeat protein
MAVRLLSRRRSRKANSNGIYLDASGDCFIVEENAVVECRKNGINLGGERRTGAAGRIPGQPGAKAFHV